MKKVSIVVLVYNVSEYLSKCLDSLVKQDYNDYEIVVVNDGSVDNSLEIIHKYENSYPNLFKVYSIKNGGRSNARNFGISKVETEFFTFVDGDDYIDEHMISKLVNNLNKDTDISICNAIRIINGRECSVLKFFRDDIEEKNKAMMVSYPGPCGKLYRTSLFKDNKLLFPKDVNYYEDMAVIPALGLYTNKITYIDEALYKYVIHDNSAIRPDSFSEKRSNDVLTVMKFLTNKFNGKYEDELEFIHIEHILRTALLRYSYFKESKDSLLKINKLIREKYPKYYQNKYYKQVSVRFKALCFLAYHKCFFLLKMLARMNVR